MRGQRVTASFTHAGSPHHVGRPSSFDSSGSSSCVTPTCDEAGNTCALVPKGDGLACNDGQDCTGPDLCTAGVCTGAPKGGCCKLATDCNDNNPCTADDCVAATGLCTHTGGRRRSRTSCARCSPRRVAHRPAAPWRSSARPAPSVASRRPIGYKRRSKRSSAAAGDGRSGGGNGNQVGLSRRTRDASQ